MPQQQRPNLSALLFFLLISLAPIASAQPGNEGRIVHGMVNALQERIAEVSRRIEDNPRDAQLYAARGSLYIDLYRALYESYYRHFYGTKPPELEVAAIATKAIADFDKAIKISPSAELHYKRAEMYEVRWASTARAMRYGVWEDLTRSPNDSWTLLTRPATEKLELAAFGKLVTDPDFTSAARDYAEALRHNKEPELSKEIHAKFARLYLSRTRAIPFSLPSIRKIVNEPNQHGYSVWADFDSALEHLSKSDGPNEAKLPEQECLWSCLKGVSRSLAYYEKAMLAIGYKRYAEALDALNESEKYFDPERYNLFYTPCWLYSERSKLHVLMGNFDAAIADASKDNPNWKGIICSRAYEPRGDAYFNKGNWQAAIADYTATLGDPSLYPSNNVYKHRALAYLRLGETEKALADLDYYINHDAGPRKPEDYHLRAQLYRQIGKEDLALADEQMESIAKVETVLVLGEIKMPDGVPYDRMKVWVRFVDATDPKKGLWTTVGDDRRFITSYEKGRSFTIQVSQEGMKDGRPVQLFGKSQKLTANGTVGPITITLDQIARKK
jgi:tetratricopeptide (TPR) repeat protein